MKYLMFICCLVFQSSRVFSSKFNEHLQFHPEGDHYLKVGSNLHLFINCTTCNSDSDFDAKNIIVMKGSQRIHDDYLNYDYNAVELTIPNLRLTHSGFYKVFYGNTNVVQDLTKVSVIEEPGSPVNITCLSFEMTNLTCSFNLSKPTSSWYMKYKLSEGSWQTIPDKYCNRLSYTCWWDSIDMPRSNMTFKGLGANMSRVKIVVKNALWTKRETFTIRISEIVKYAPVQDIHAVMGTDSMLIQWGRSKNIPGTDVAVEYRITVKSDNNWIEPITRLIYNSTRKIESVEIDGLIPYDNYTVSVWNKVMDAKGDIYWSDPAIIGNRTLPTVSQYSVSMATGSYLMYECGEKFCVILYWKNPEERYWHGQLVGYQISVDTNYTFRQDGAHGLIAVQGISEYVRLKEPLSKTNNYLLGVSLVNTEGNSADVSPILIPAWEKANMMKVTWVSVEMLPSGDKISWEINPDLCSHIVSVTIYWCLNLNSSIVQCVSDFDWHTYDIDNGCEDNWQLISTNISGMIDLKYGVSIENHQFSGGIEWEKFRFKNIRNVPEKPMFRVNADKTMVTVNVLYASNYVSDFGRPDVYYISYSKASQKTQKKCTYDETKTEFPVNFSQPIYRISGLESGSQYYICVWSGNAAGLSEAGKPVSIKTNEDTNLKIIVALSIGGGVIIIIIIIICMCRCFKNWRRRIIDDNTGIRVPDFDRSEFASNEFDKNEHDITADSGKGDSSPSSVTQDSVSENRYMSESIVNRLDKVGMCDDLKPEDNSGNTVSAATPLIQDYSRASKPLAGENVEESFSLLDRQDSIDFDSGNSDIFGISNVDRDESVANNLSEYVDHDFGKKTEIQGLKNYVALTDLKRETSMKNEEDYLPHSSLGKATSTPIVKEMAKPNCADYVDECMNPMVNKQTYETPLFTGRPEHFYHEIKELEIEDEDDKDNHENSSAKGVNPSDKVTLENQSSDNSILDSYNVAYVGSKQSNDTNVISTDYIEVDTVVGVNLVAGPVSNNELGSGPVSNEKEKAGPGSNDHLRTGPVSNEKLETGPVFSNELEIETVPNDKYEAGSMSKDKLETEYIGMESILKIM
ncbi:hypothetical protein ACF0H5_011943 [Mactra antiquata]